jgi:3-deoxy-D-manno-octulosonate 8-phosphate phosphatase (KDO 8-P phosphatase)
MEFVPRDLKATAKKHFEKLDKIRLFLIDADGILTPGHVYWASEEVGFSRQFHVHDGYGIKSLMKLGIQVGVISGGDSISLMKRVQDLGVTYSFCGNEDKRASYTSIQQKSGLADENILYMGDELFDMPILERVGFSATNTYAPLEVRECVDYITQKGPGQGCVREVIDMLRYAQKLEIPVPGFEQ